MQKLYWLVLWLCVGCAAQEENTAVTTSRPPEASAVATGPSTAGMADTLAAKAADGFLNPAQFKAARLDTFRIGQTDKLVQLTAAEERKYLQQSMAHSIYKPYHFYSIQENTALRKVITLLSYDGEYKSDLLRLVYDRQNKLISKQIVAADASDGDVGDEAYGWFDAPTLFCFVEVQKQPVRETQDAIEYAVDSVVSRYQVSHEQFKQIQQRKFQRRAVEAQVQK
ncbi:hypothetical protein [Hymenobacter gelipurpurascens]|nr:hypothetical protein [Hymenobacter gelipurpurascens]